MEDEIQAGVCGGEWLNSLGGRFGTSLFSSAAVKDISIFGWSNDMMEISRSEDYGSVSSERSMVFQDIQDPQPPNSVGGGQNMQLDSGGLEMMGIDLPCSMTTDLNQALLNETGIECVPIQKEWGNKNFSDVDKEKSINYLNLMNKVFSLEQQLLNSISSPSDCVTTCQGLSSSSPQMTGSPSFSDTSTWLQTLLDADPQQNLLENQSMNYSSTSNSPTDLNEFSSTLLRFPSSSKAISPAWNVSAGALRCSFSPSVQSQSPLSIFQQKINGTNLLSKVTNEVREQSNSTIKKSSSEPAFKRLRIETPLPTFKVRKEKLGDRITALQQLVSPFGKTDTASVLHEAIEYIKFLHGQVTVLSTPCMKNGAATQYQQNSNYKVNDTEWFKQDLRSRGLCLAPISSTFSIASETPSDFWTPKFEATTIFQ
uniref:Transcription factor bHLH17 n=1 Tax=Nothapodytes nimmoniana TaxID=159386 RepID=A0A9E8Z395_NOTNI|nr:transcription factor bHLH17 [Nothapodytes nimmoniana]